MALSLKEKDYRDKVAVKAMKQIMKGNSFSPRYVTDLAFEIADRMVLRSRKDPHDVRQRKDDR